MKGIILLIFTAVLVHAGYAQDIPIGAWETHFGYRSAKHILKTEKKIFCSTYNGFFSIDLTDDKVTTYGKADGLSESGVNAMAYDSSQNLIILVYRSGNMDLLYLDASFEPREIVNWPFLATATDLPDNKTFNKILIREDKAFLGSNFGIVVLNITTREIEESYRYIGSAGAEAMIYDMTFTDDSLFAATNQGLLATSMRQSVNRQYFANWKTISTPSLPVSVSYQNEKIYAGFPGKGIYQKTGDTWDSIYASESLTYHFSERDHLVTSPDRIFVLEENTPVIYQNPLFTSLRETLRSDSFFWSADNKQGLLSNHSGSFSRYGPMEGDTTIATTLDSTVTDLNGLIWTRLPTTLGGGISVKNQTTGQQKILGTNTGNGGLPSSLIYSLAVDEDGYVWFSSERGVGYFISDDIFSASTVDAILPVYGQRKLFSSERANAIAVEPGNRKWIGTNTGLYQFTADGTELLKKFTADDSPLPSTQIDKLSFKAETGRLYIATPNGMASYRSDATTPAENLSGVTIYPNPVHVGYDGLLGLKGLTGNAVVKFTDLSGRLVFETRSQGGTASWNLNDYTGKRVRSGIYLVIIVSSDRSQKIAGKLAVIN